MKNKSFVISVFIMSLLGSAYKIADDILQQLGVQKQGAEFAIMSNLLNVQPPDPNCSGDCGGRLIIPKAKALADIMSGDKKAAAKELCQYVKGYIESAEFNESYQKKRESAKPYYEKPNTPDPEYLKGLQKSISEFEGEYKQAKDAQTKKMYGDMITTFKKNYKQASDPMPQTTAWREKYPETVDSLIRKQLNVYLSEQATVDFSAQIVLRGKTKYFVKPEYEKKSPTWKAVYRAGKEVNMVVATFVQEWLKTGIVVAKTTSGTGTSPTSETNTMNPENNANNSKPEKKDMENVQSKPDSTKPIKSLLKKVKGKIGF